MKKYVLSFLIGITCTLSAFGQSFITQHTDTVITNIPVSGGDFGVYNLIKSASAGDIYLKWKVVNNNIPSDWTLTGFCDNVLCYNTTPNLLNGTQIQVSDAYSSASWGDFHAVFNGDNAALGSQAMIRIMATDTVANYSRTLTFIATKWATGVSTIVKGDDILLYPNPARSHVNAVFDASMGVKNIAIYNLIGKVVSVFKVNGSSAKLNLEEIPAGIYFVRLINGQGQIVATRKFTHQ